jgi:cysteine synthase A
VCSPGTGGTAATLGRYVRYKGYETRILCADPETSAFFDCYRGEWPEGARPLAGSGIEGIGRPTPEASFIPQCIDAMVKVPDALSLACMRHVSRTLGRKVGGSTGTNMAGVIALAIRMREAGVRGSIVTILCDGGERYEHSYYSDDWYRQQDMDVALWDARMARFLSGETSLADMGGAEAI